MTNKKISIISLTLRNYVKIKFKKLSYNQKIYKSCEKKNKVQVFKCTITQYKR